MPLPLAAQTAVSPLRWIWHLRTVGLPDSRMARPERPLLVISQFSSVPLPSCHTTTPARELSWIWQRLSRGIALVGHGHARALVGGDFTLLQQTGAAADHHHPHGLAVVDFATAQHRGRTTAQFYGGLRRIAVSQSSR